MPRPGSRFHFFFPANDGDSNRAPYFSQEVDYVSRGHVLDTLVVDLEERAKLGHSSDLHLLRFRYHYQNVALFKSTVLCSYAVWVHDGYYCVIAFRLQTEAESTVPSSRQFHHEHLLQVPDVSNMSNMHS